MSWSADQEPHRARWAAESFGADPQRYDRARPRYPEAMVERIVTAIPGPEVLEVGIGTGIAARQFQEAGCRVLGVDPDARMAELARAVGLEVEVASFEEWDADGRSFDAVLAGQAWHWIDPVVGAAKAARILRPGGLLAPFWNVQSPRAEVAEAFAEVYRRVLGADTLFSRGTPSLQAYSPILAKAGDGIREAGAFEEPEQWRFDWQRSYTRDEWLDHLPTSGGHSRFPPETLAALLEGTGAAIDTLGGSFTMPYVAVVVTARRGSARR